jgi:hypothetical protein
VEDLLRELAPRVLGTLAWTQAVLPTCSRLTSQHGSLE